MAITPNTFDLFAAIDETAVPADSVVIHTDAQALYTYEILDGQINRISDPDSPLLETLNEQLETARAELEASAHEVTIRPLPEAERTKIQHSVFERHGVTEEDEITGSLADEIAYDLDNAVMAAAVVSIKRVRDGAVQDNITEANIATLRKLPPLVWQKLVDLYRTLLLENAVYSANAEDPNF